ncbi:hypothetical protein G7046_g3012 [Stylonectria norvegica]|nr:hypothetical protein G7046_g3012 [Stylonectria norvegica]
MANETEFAERWRKYHDDFDQILGSKPTIKLLQIDEYPFAHEAGVFIDQTNDLYITSNQFNDEFGQKQVVISKVSLGDGNTANKLEQIKCDLIHMANGGVNYKDGVLFCAQGSPTHPSGLFHMQASPPYKTEPVLTSYLGRPFNSLNDVVLHHDGSIWFTDPSYGYDQGHRPRPSLPNAVYRYDPKSQSIRAVADGFGRPNGICFSPDCGTVYVTDTDQVRGPRIDYSRSASIYAFDVTHYHGQPFLTNRRLFAMADTGIPDGVNIWSPGGVLLGKVIIQGGVANFCFGRSGQIFALNENRLWNIQLNSELRGALLGILSKVPNTEPVTLDGCDSHLPRGELAGVSHMVMQLQGHQMAQALANTKAIRILDDCIEFCRDGILVEGSMTSMISSLRGYKYGGENAKIILFTFKFNTRKHLTLLYPKLSITKRGFPHSLYHFLQDAVLCLHATGGHCLCTSHCPSTIKVPTEMVNREVIKDKGETVKISMNSNMVASSKLSRRDISFSINPVAFNPDQCGSSSFEATSDSSATGSNIDDCNSLADALGGLNQHWELNNGFGGSFIKNWARLALTVGTCSFYVNRVDFPDATTDGTVLVGTGDASDIVRSSAANFQHWGIVTYPGGSTQVGSVIPVSGNMGCFPSSYNTPWRVQNSQPSN